MLVQKNDKRRIYYAIGWLLAASILLYSIAYMYEKPGGFADWRASRAMSLEETLQIPLGKTPEDALRQFRREASLQIIHQEKVEGGMLLFAQQPQGQEGNNLRVEYVRKAWLGWKWVTGGGYGITLGNLSNAKPEAPMQYMSLPATKEPKMPFTLVFGRVQDAAITDIRIEIKGGTESVKYPVHIVATDKGHAIWFVQLPVTARAPFEIEGRNEDGVLLAHQTVGDVRENGTIGYTE